MATAAEGVLPIWCNEFQISRAGGKYGGGILNLAQIDSPIKINANDKYIWSILIEQKIKYVHGF